MALVAVDNLEVGMVLAADVLDRNGRMLLGAGAELNRKHLVIFRTWGIAEVQIVGDDSNEEPAGPLPAEIDPAAVEAAQERLLPLFACSGTEHPVMRELLLLAALRKVQHGLC
ncbi:hypothetical protein [Trichlorobacter ammonificans]|uniref:Uncharacterized protein n=1 Tax=Trichlorobacter ammonificans TaxID=2916410 RepID=A0ABM9D544_9BACT|nr:hypothetical protein [Trichlorobacter ammonificans]CAH2030363.1 conserved protein of unknown function [Trichlorobacter ammonificans]